MRQKLVGVLVTLVMVAALPSCTDTHTCLVQATDETSVATLWNEATLDAIRRDFPAPTVHARNLWHLSAVMWDVWSAYTPGTQMYFNAPVAPDSPRERLAAIEEAMSHAAHRLLSERYEFAIGGEVSLTEFDALLSNFCLEQPDNPDPASPAGVGRSIAQAAIDFGNDDGALEINRYIDLSYQPINDPLVVASDEVEMADPNRWQPLRLSEQITQNGQTLGPGVQIFVGSQWGSVTSFALPEPDDRGVTIDPGPPPLFATETEDEFVAGAIDVIGYSDALGGSTGEGVIDISPASRGNSAVGANDGHGWPENPATGEPYAANHVPLQDFGRAIAEFWADGPDSETPPGHWNTLAIAATDAMDQDELRWRGTGPAMSRLEWDLRLFFTMNAALHDAAIATWGTKRAYDYARPISMIRYLGAQGKLPETPGLVELVTQASAAPGGEHQGLTVGATAVRSWLGPVSDPESQLAGVGWRDSIDWLPYQRPTFVSPAFAGYVSGHSAFSRAAADVLASATGDEFFPGGLFTHTVSAGSFIHEEGPTVDVVLQWATYGDAADEAGESRRYGGIHVAVDDIEGRVLGAQVADLAWDEAQDYFGS